MHRGLAVAVAAVVGGALSAGAASMQVAPFGQTPDGQAVLLYSLSGAGGMKADITDYGGIVVRLMAPDRTGRLADVVLGYNTLAEYLKDSPYFGCIVGRYGNRIAGGAFALDGATYKLATNNEPGGVPCHLHGGLKGFDKRVWDSKPVFREGACGVQLRLTSPDGEEGYPGTLKATVTYWLTDGGALEIRYEAVTDKPTVLNLTHHGYFNLKGEGDGDILGHRLTFKAARFTPVDKGLIPTGELRPVAGTPFDFTTPHAIGERVNAVDEQIKFGGGYDHNWVLDSQDGSLALAAVVEEPESGRSMEVWTTEPGLQFYCGNFLDGHLIGKSGRLYPHRSGLCLETQHYPDSPNQPRFPSTTLRPGSVYKSATVYKFGTVQP